MEKKYLKYKTKYFRKLMFGKGDSPSLSLYSVEKTSNGNNEPYYVIKKLNTNKDEQITSAFIQCIKHREYSILKVRFNLKEETQFIFEEWNKCFESIKEAFDNNKLPTSVSVNYEEKVLEGMKHLLNEEYKNVYFAPARTIQSTDDITTVLQERIFWTETCTTILNNTSCKLLKPPPE